MNCFDCANRMRGTFPHDTKWTCSVSEVKRFLRETNGGDFFLIEQALKGCNGRWKPKPHPTQEDWDELSRSLTMYPSRNKVLLADFKAKFYVGRNRRPRHKRKSHQMELTLNA